MAADATPLTPVTGIHQLPIGIGQRVCPFFHDPSLPKTNAVLGKYDVIVDTSVGSDGDAYYIRAAMCAASIAAVPSSYDIYALAALRYVASGSTATTTAPTSSDWSDSDNSETTCSDFADSNLVPLDATAAPTTVLDSTILVSVFHPIYACSDLTAGPATCRAHLLGRSQIPTMRLWLASSGTL